MTKEELKQRVIELLIKAEDDCESTKFCKNCVAYGKGADCRAYMFADHLIANDVTIRERGEWRINCDGYYPYCPKCMREPESGKMTDFCPHCGADMRGDE